MKRVLEPEVMEGDEEAAAYDELDRRWGDVLFQGFAESACHLGVVAGRVLDVGSGPGRIAIRLARLNRALEIDGIDLSRSMLDRAASLSRAAGVADRVRFSRGDAKRIPFEDHTFDLVIAHQILHQLADPVIALREINRVAKPEGAILVRDVRRLPGPLLTVTLPIWCLGYSAKLREFTYASFRAGFTVREFRDMVDEAGIEGATIRRHFLTHLGLERRARDPRPFAAVDVPASPGVRLLKWPYLSRAAARGGSHSDHA